MIGECHVTFQIEKAGGLQLTSTKQNCPTTFMILMYDSSISRLASSFLSPGQSLKRDCREMPFAFFGHSMGAWIAYELAQARERWSAIWFLSALTYPDT